MGVVVVVGGRLGEPPIYSLLVRSPGDNLNLGLASEVWDLLGLSPSLWTELPPGSVRTESHSGQPARVTENRWGLRVVSVAARDRRRHRRKAVSCHLPRATGLPSRGRQSSGCSPSCKTGSRSYFYANQLTNVPGRNPVYVQRQKSHQHPFYTHATQAPNPPAVSCLPSSGWQAPSRATPALHLSGPW